ncbi:VanZ like protein [Tamaricihabitans halophyticus]|uniref:VanZ like protein n=1 Tax=Tamaricihabitans halophyticus TaxID=1262583 RepID=A0A4R2QA44_9PSEU|nr:VanZ family protein [Tamaricihabitans halophyticus]TCP45772.1 VanZ like protein [Tamaricihabitans halophyticus]
MSSTVASGLIAIFVGMALAVALFIPIVVVSYRRHGRLSLARLLGWVSTCVYAIAIWSYTLLPLPSEGYTCAGVQLNLAEAVADINKYDVSGPRAVLTNPAVMQFLFNVALFMPLGFLLRTMFRRGVVIATTAGLAVSLVVELTQLTGVWGLYECAYRVFDVSDLLTNTTGAFLGSLIALAVVRRARPVGSPALGRVTAGRRFLGMLCDLLFLFLAGAVVGLLWRIGLLIGTGEPFGVPQSPVEPVLSTWLPLLIQFVVVLATGSTIGERAVLLRPTNPRFTTPVTRVLRFLGGIGGYGILVTEVVPLGGMWAMVFVLVSAIMIFTTRGRRGLSAVIARTDIEDARAAPNTVSGERVAG